MTGLVLLAGCVAVENSDLDWPAGPRICPDGVSCGAPVPEVWTLRADPEAGGGGANTGGSGGSAR